MKHNSEMVWNYVVKFYYIFCLYLTKDNKKLHKKKNTFVLHFYTQKKATARLVDCLYNKHVCAVIVNVKASSLHQIQNRGEETFSQGAISLYFTMCIYIQYIEELVTLGFYGNHISWRRDNDWSFTLAQWTTSAIFPTPSYYFIFMYI